MTESDWLPFEYRDFYDVPRLLLVDWGDHALLLDSPFDEKADEYSDVYHVYPLQPETAKQLRAKKAWNAAALATEPIATVPVRDIQFAPSRRKSLLTSVFESHGIR